MRRRLVPTLAALALAGAACNKPAAKPPAATELKTEDEKTMYALGLLMGRDVARLHLSAPELEAVKKGLDDSASGRTAAVDLQVYGPKVQKLAQERMAAGAKADQEKMAADAQAEKARSLGYEEAAAKEPGAVKTASGLIFRSLEPGKGPSPSASDQVSVHYEGKLIDGTVFDSSLKRGQPAEFPLNGVIPCWTEGLQKMKVGGKARLVCPAEIAYKDRSMGHIPAGATLTFEVQLLGIKGKS
jgi:FKBP-type peptidyl-prolyl cis-trans isomerase FkpA